MGGKEKADQREKFLDEMDKVVPSGRIVRLIEPHYPKADNRRRPIGLERILHIYFLQQWYGLSDPGLEEALYDMESLRRFAGIDLGEQEIPDETTILNFRRLLEKHQLTEKLWEEVKEYLSEKKFLLQIRNDRKWRHDCCASSTKNKDKKRAGRCV